MLVRKIKVLIICVFVAALASAFPFPWHSFATKGQSPLSAPTRVTASDSAFVLKTTIIWDAVRDATTYRVFRNTINDPLSATEAGTTAAASFADTTGTQGQEYFYWVRAENSSAMSPLSDPDQGKRVAGYTGQSSFPVLSPPPAPALNPVTAAKSTLGKVLFWDEQMSSTRTVSCGTCHIPSAGGSDPRSRLQQAFSTNPGFDNTFGSADDVVGSIGVPLSNANGSYSLDNLFGMREQVTGRKANPSIDAAYFGSAFWDGRASGEFRDPLTNSLLIPSGAALESQALGPPLSSVEMAHQGRDWVQTAARIASSKPLALSPSMPQPLKTWIGARSYPQLFQEAFGSPDVTPARIAMAIATYERTLYSDQTPLDKATAEIAPLTIPEENGRDLFIELRCNFCHTGSILSDSSFENIGVRPSAEDTGRFRVTNNPAHLGRFKVPGLRNVALRGPYMHNGRFSSLEEVVEFYNRGGDFDAPNIDRNLIRPMGLSAAEKASLVAFLGRPLTDPRVAAELPPFDRPALYSESSRVPQIIGTGVPGVSAQVPLAIAVEPPLVGNPSFTVGVSKALAGANAVLVIDDNDPGTGASIPSSGSFARIAIQLQGSGSEGFGSVSIPIPNNPSLANRAFTGRWYITDPASSTGIAISRAFRFTIFADSSFIARAKPADFDGDGKTDTSISRANGASREWWWARSSDLSVPAITFGNSADLPTAFDFTGDGKTDIAFFRPSSGQWFILRSEDNNFYAFNFGVSGDIPAPADYDGDGKSDAAVYRPGTGTWFILRSSDNQVAFSTFGAVADKPAVADFDGDGKADISIWKPALGQWWRLNSADSSLSAYQFGVAGDLPVQGDYTGDGKADVAIFRPSNATWYILRSEDLNFYAFPFGAGLDIPAPGDYDGDGKIDAGIFRPSQATWFINQSGSGVLIRAFGASGDLPLPGAQAP